MKQNNFLKIGYIAFLSAIVCSIIFHNLINLSYNGFSFSNMYILALSFICINYMGLKDINVGGTVRINFTSAVKAFIFMVFGINAAVIFTVVFEITHNFFSYNERVDSNEKKILDFNVLIIYLFLASSITNLFFSLKFINKGMDNVLAMAIFLFAYKSTNLIFYMINRSVLTGKIVKINLHLIKYITIDYAISLPLLISLFSMYKYLNLLGFTIIMIIYNLLQHFIYLSRKLGLKEELTQKMLSMTNRIIKIGNFNSKCEYLIEEFDSIVPDSFCSIIMQEKDNKVVIPFDSKYRNKGSNTSNSLIELFNTMIKNERIVNGEIYFNSKFSKDKAINLEAEFGINFKALTAVPVINEEQIIGLLIIVGNHALNEFMRNDLEGILKILANQIALAYINSSEFDEIKAKSETDSLTNLYNRGVFDQEIEKISHNHERFSLAIFDIDNFKRINDTYGHLAGDKVLKNVSNIIMESIRKSDIACRYGGEEIAIIFKNLSKKEALIISERIRRKIEKQTILHQDLVLKVTISAGIAGFPEDCMNPAEIISLADNALYKECKTKGKNKVSGFRIIK